jgi:nicotinamide riboside kinase
MEKLRFEHITHFGKSQMQQVKDAVEYGDFPIVFSDTDAIVSSVFQEIYFRKIADELLDEVKKEHGYWDLILFTNSDVPWVDDGQRNLQDQREEVSQKFLSIIQNIGSPYVIIEGDWKQRLEKAIDVVNKLIT